MSNELGAAELGPEDVEGHALESEREAVDVDRDAVAEEPEVEGHVIIDGGSVVDAAVEPAVTD